MTIDATDANGLTQEKLQEFANNIDDKEINIYKESIKILSCKKEDLVKSISSFDVVESDIYELQISDVILKCFGKDLLWWTKTSKRIEKFEAIINRQTKERKKKIDILDDKVYYIAVATLVDNELSNIHHFEGNKKDCIDFINQDMLNRYIDNMLNAKIVINLAFDVDEFNRIFSTESSLTEEKNAYKKNIEFWYTIDELEQMGAITTI